MAHKDYFLPTKQLAILRNSIEEYYGLLASYKLVKDEELLLYDINNVAIILEKRFNAKLKKYGLGNITMIGEHEDILKIKSEIQEKTKLELEEVK